MGGLLDQRSAAGSVATGVGQHEAEPQRRLLADGVAAAPERRRRPGDERVDLGIVVALGVADDGVEQQQLGPVAVVRRRRPAARPRRCRRAAPRACCAPAPATPRTASSASPSRAASEPARTYEPAARRCSAAARPSSRTSAAGIRSASVPCHRSWARSRPSPVWATIGTVADEVVDVDRAAAQRRPGCRRRRCPSSPAPAGRGRSAGSRRLTTSSHTNCPHPCRRGRPGDPRASRTSAGHPPSASRSAASPPAAAASDAELVAGERQGVLR